MVFQNKYRMQTFTKIFNTKYPIACMAMNQVSDVPLAIAVRNAGCLPSLSIFNYYAKTGIISLGLFEADLKGYLDEVGDTSILISLSTESILDIPNFLEMLLSYRVKAVEIILEDQNTDYDHRRNVLLPQAISSLRANGTMVFTKTLHATDIMDNTDGIVLKGPDGAGRGNLTGETLSQLFDKFTARYPGQHVITSGGVGTSEQLKYYIDRGAFAVGIGTMFAVSAESKISTESKLKLVASSAADVKRLDNGKTLSDSQNAIVFNQYTNQDNQNNTRSLAMGVRSPSLGHVFIGKGIEHANEILTCEEIVQRLVKDL